MSSIDPTSGSTYDALGLGAKKTGAKEGAGLQDQFMTLMLTQMKNQDPLKPMENGDFLAQLAQFNTVSGIQELQQSFSNFAASMQGSQALQASSLVGREVLVPGDSLQLAATGGVAGEAALPYSTGAMQLSVYDASGQLVRTLPMGAQRAGEVRFAWDGLNDAGQRAPAGTYRVTAAAQIDGEMVALPTLMAATVESVTLGQGGREIWLNVAGQGEVPMSSVLKIM